jgi:hypothetical protein
MAEGRIINRLSINPINVKAVTLRTAAIKAFGTGDWSLAAAQIGE